MINRKIVKSNASRVQPSQAATQASHWSLVGSFHHATVFAVSAATAMTFLPLSVPDDRDRDRVPESCYIPDYSQRDYQRQAARRRNVVPISGEERPARPGAAGRFLCLVAKPFQGQLSGADRPPGEAIFPSSPSPRPRLQSLPPTREAVP